MNRLCVCLPSRITFFNPSGSQAEEQNIASSSTAIVEFSNTCSPWGCLTWSLHKKSNRSTSSNCIRTRYRSVFLASFTASSILSTRTPQSSNFGSAIKSNKKQRFSLLRSSRILYVLPVPVVPIRSRTLSDSTRDIGNYP